MGLSLEVIQGTGRNGAEARVHTASPELERVIESEPYFKAEQDREAFENSIHVYEGGQVLPPEVRVHETERTTSLDGWFTSTPNLKRREIDKVSHRGHPANGDRSS